MSGRRRAAFLLVGAFAAGCSDEVGVCYPGEYVACTCDDGRAGYARCDDEGTSYEPCGHCGTVPGIGGGTEGGGGGGLLPFMSECEEDAQCETGLCHLFPAKGSFCTHACETSDECEAPSPGCNMMGLCKAP